MMMPANQKVFERQQTQQQKEKSSPLQNQQQQPNTMIAETCRLNASRRRRARLEMQLMDSLPAPMADQNLLLAQMLDQKRRMFHLPALLEQQLDSSAPRFMHSSLLALSEQKRKLQPASCDSSTASQEEPSKKKRRTSSEEIPEDALPTIHIEDLDDTHAIPTIPASEEGLSIVEDKDVLSGRGTNTNLHPGNRTFRGLVSKHRKTYLDGVRRDKKALSRAVVNAIRKAGGRFLKKDEKSGLWFEVGDNVAREKSSQALRQRGPRMRRMLFETDREESRQILAEAARMRHVRSMMATNNPAGAPIMAAGMANRRALPALYGPTTINPPPSLFQIQAAPSGAEAYAMRAFAADRLRLSSLNSAPRLYRDDEA
jgi:hypothetical protein